MDLIHALILGVVEGITEFLPISSTGHLILTSQLLHIPDSEFLKSFEIAIQLGAIAAVALLYIRSFFSIPVLTRLAAGFLPTAVIGFTLYPLVKGYLLGNSYVVVAALALGGVVLIAFELLHKDKMEDADVLSISHRHAFCVGLFQSLALVPGVSRSAATIVGGLSLGLSRATIVEFSFLLAVPTMLAATLLDVVKSHAAFVSADVAPLLVGFVSAFVVALFAIRFLLRYVRNHSFIPFGIYRIVVAILFFVFIL